MYGNHERGGFPKDCPLDPIIEKRCRQNDTSDYWYASGWNDCIDEICKNEK